MEKIDSSGSRSGRRLHPMGFDGLPRTSRPKVAMGLGTWPSPQLKAVWPACAYNTPGTPGLVVVISGRPIGSYTSSTDQS
jgi:hypothetical protein